MSKRDTRKGKTKRAIRFNRPNWRNERFKDSRSLWKRRWVSLENGDGE